MVISRTDSIGDVLLTLPITAWLKEHFPGCHITFLCRNYTAPIVQCYEGVDDVLLLETIEALPAEHRAPFIAAKHFDTVIHVFPRKALAQLFKKAGVPNRIGTSHRLFHLFTCNMRPAFTRKGSPFHEAQLNFELLRPLGVQELPSFDRLNAWCDRLVIPEVQLPEFIENRLGGPKTIVLHPKSQGSAREWPMENYAALALELAVHGWTVFFTGTESEGQQFRSDLPVNERISDTTGKLTIGQLMWLLKRTDALVACSTGPLHLAGFMNKRAVGLFAPRIPIHPGRWKALGRNSVALVNDENCAVCRAKKPCDCIAQIPVAHVIQALMSPEQ
jgi:ADP-heptose:LPS heptosyltransferase